MVWHLLGRPLPHRAGDHPGLAEPAAPGAAAEQLDVEAVVDDFDEGHQLLSGVGPGPEVGDGPLLHPLGGVVGTRGVMPGQSRGAGRPPSTGSPTAGGGS